MTTNPRLFGLTAALALAVAATVGCSGSEPPHPIVTGTGGDVSTTTPSPLCDSNGNTGAGGAFTPGTMTGGGPIKPGGFSQFPPQFGATVSAAVPPPAISGGTLRVLADGHTAVAA